VTAPEATRRAERAPVNLAFVLDRSGSMGGQKIRLAAQAVEEAIGRLHPSDRFSIVTYDDTVETLHERIKEVERRIYPEVLWKLVQ